MPDRAARADWRVAVLARSVYPLHGVGGLERHVFDLVRHHLADGLTVALFTRAAANRMSDPRALAAWDAIASHPRFSLHPVPYRTFPFAGRRGTTILDRSTAYPRFGLRAGREAARAVRAGGVDIVYAVGASAFGYALARARHETDAPLVLNPQGLEEFGGPDGRYGGQWLKAPAYAPLRRVVRTCAAAADTVIATDRALEPVVVRHLRVPRSRVRLVPNGIDVDGCLALAGAPDGRRVRAEAGVPPQEVLLLSVGRLERNKGFQHLARALAKWANRPAWTWTIVGNGPYRRTLERTVAACGIASRVRWMGRVTDETLHAWYEAADLFVHPTMYEGSSLVTLEAMAHGRPVLASCAGGLPDKVEPGVTGWLARPADSAALGGALDEAIARRDEWRRMGEAGRRLARDVFDWPVIERALLDVYAAVRRG
jgi:glycosyltransferase involved in cell wall biosynthesis